MTVQELLRPEDGDGDPLHLVPDLTNLEVEDETPEPRGRNLLTIPLVRAVMTSRLYPGVLQWIVLAVFVLVGYELLTGPDRAHDNLGTALMWVLWWPLIPILFLFVGRFWCAVCPFATLHDWVQKLVGLERPVPL